MCSPSISGRTKSCGRPTIRTATASSRGAPQMIKDRMAGASLEVQYQVLAGGAMGFYGLN
jgi:hypothetical protein